MTKIIFLISLGVLQVTSYRAVPSQTDSSPFFTSTGDRVHNGGCAVSRDLLCGACRRLHRRCQHPEDLRHLHYGDWLYSDRFGFRQINDVMGEAQHYKVKTNKGKKRLFKKILLAVDLFVDTKDEEKRVNVRHVTMFRAKLVDSQVKRKDVEKI